MIFTHGEVAILMLCINCRFYAGPRARVECRNRENLFSFPDYVNGGELKSCVYSTAQPVRINGRLCGPDGAWFEPIETQEQVV